MSLSGKKIFLDPGHGGKDPGAVGPNGSKESDVTLSVSKLLKDKLERMGATIFMSRDSDEDVSISRRVSMANSSKANIFVSVHCNAYNDTAKGVETLYHQTSSAGKKLAGLIQSELVSSTNSVDRGIKADKSLSRFPNGLPVLRDTVMPAVLVELEFISNPTYEKILTNPRWQEVFADAIVQGILSYF
jgi:N-acetylmuramoyl-L-alanine amidase